MDRDDDLSCRWCASFGLVFKVKEVNLKDFFEEIVEKKPKN